MAGLRRLWLPLLRLPLASSTPSSPAWLRPGRRRWFASASSSSSAPDDAWPVVIVGAGPSGLVLSALLSNYGVRNLVLERAEELTRHPRAHFINARSMEVLRGLALPPPGSSGGGTPTPATTTTVAARVRALCPPLDEWRRFVYCTSLLRPDEGVLIGAVDHFPAAAAAGTKAAAAAAPSAPSPVAGAAEAVAHLPQPRLLALLLEAAEHAALSKPAVLFGREAVGLERGDDDGLVVLVKEAAKAKAAEERCPQPPQPRLLRLRARFVVAADGARGGLRDAALGRRPGEGRPDAMQHLINVHFTHPPLGKAILAASAQGGAGGRSAAPSSSSASPSSPPPPPSCPPAMLYFVLNADVVAVIVAHDLSRGEFVAQLPYWPPLQDARGGDFSAAACAALVRAAVLPPASSSSSSSASAAAASASAAAEAWRAQGWPRVEQARPWAMDVAVEERWGWAAEEVAAAATTQPRQSSGAASSSSSCARPAVPRFFLVGDSAHRFPPAGGFGMNTGLQDAHALAWRLALAARAEEEEAEGVRQQNDSGGGVGRIGAPVPAPIARLLHSYGAERRPVALANAALGVSNWREASAVPAALGLDPRAAEVAAAAASAAAAFAAPLGAPAAEAGRAAARTALGAALAAGRAAASAALPLRRGAARAVLERGDSLRLQFPREDLGFVYGGVGVGVGVGGGAGPSAAAVAADEDDDDDGAAATNAPSSSGRGSPYVPSLRPGARMPHAPLELVAGPFVPGASGGGAPAAALFPSFPFPDCSTLDFVGTASLPPGETTSGPRCLVVASGADPDLSAARRAAERLRDAEGWPLDLLLVLPSRAEAAQAAVVAAAGSGAPDQRRRRTWVARDVAGDWARLWPAGGGGGGVALVRPDGHVAWRRLQRRPRAGEGEGEEQHRELALADAVRGVMREVLGLSPLSSTRR